MKKTLILLLMIFAVFSEPETNIRAAGETEGSITIECGEADVVWNLCLTGVPDSSGNIDTCGKFSVLAFPGVTKYDEKYFSYSGVLADFVKENSISPDKTAVSDENGRAVFTGLSEGFYVAVPDILETESFYFISSPVAVFAGDREDSQLRDVTVEPKSYTVEATPEDREWVFTFKYDRTDKWKNYLKNPFSSEVSGGPEIPPVFTDIYTEVTPVTSLNEETPVTAVTEAVTEESVTAVTSETTVRKMIITDENLPQTGQSWLPVPVMAGCGMLLLVLGSLIKGKS